MSLVLAAAVAVSPASAMKTAPFFLALVLGAAVSPASVTDRARVILGAAVTFANATAFAGARFLGRAVDFLHDRDKRNVCF